MKIGIDIRTLMDQEYSGIPEYSYNLIKEILQQDKVNEYKLFYNSLSDLDYKFLEFKQSNTEIINFGLPNKFFNYFSQKMFKNPVIDKKLGVDVVFVPHISFIALSDLCKKIITVHDLSYLRFPQYFSIRKNFWHHSLNIKKYLRKFDKVIAISENTKKDIIELCGISKDKIKVIYSGINHDYRVFAKQDKNIFKVKKKYNLPDKFILSMCTIEPRKNIINIIKAFDCLQERYLWRDLKLVIVGGKGWKNKTILKELQKSKNIEKILLLGYIDSVDKKYLYNLSQIFIYPSFYEGFGFPPLEAQKCGTPVIASNSSSLPEILKDSAVFIDPYNENELFLAIKSILENKQLEKDLKIKGLKNTDYYSWKKTAQKYVDKFIGHDA